MREIIARRRGRMLNNLLHRLTHFSCRVASGQSCITQKTAMNSKPVSFKYSQSLQLSVPHCNATCYAFFQPTKHLLQPSLSPPAPHPSCSSPQSVPSLVNPQTLLDHLLPRQYKLIENQEKKNTYTEVHTPLPPSRTPCLAPSRPCLPSKYHSDSLEN